MYMDGNCKEIKEDARLKIGCVGKDKFTEKWVAYRLTEKVTSNTVSHKKEVWREGNMCAKTQRIETKPVLGT